MSDLNLNLILAIVVRAMKENFTISTSWNSINIDNKDGKYLNFRLYDEENSEIYIESDTGKDSIKNISEEDILRFQLLVKDCEKYEQGHLYKDIQSFFPPQEVKEEPAKTINDLDNEDD